jgi:hypothetical protein
MADNKTWRFIISVIVWLDIHCSGSEAPIYTTVNDKPEGSDPVGITGPIYIKALPELSLRGRKTEKT